MSDLEAVLEDCLAYLEDREDCDYDMNPEGGGWVPNRAMRLAGDVREALEELRRGSCE